ncbi:MAG: hypothetical protein ABSB35_02515 [Bryobacteraceae bacterium]|jgi:hypothetical protein
MLGIFSRAVIKTGTAESRIGFASEGGGSYEVWDRCLTVDGKRAYHLGNVCQTCQFLFERLDGANTSVEVDRAVDALGVGISSISDPVVAGIGTGLPTDDYIVCLSDAKLQLVRPGDQDDYFRKEQTDLWGVNAFWDLPHDPRVPCYRAGDVNLEKGVRLFHFVIPMFPESWLKKGVVSEYADRFDEEASPTPIAIALLDVKGPAIFEGEIVDPAEHWTIAHFLIDGHHKAAAARKTGRAVRLLNFLSLTHGISSREQVERSVDASSPE